ncbi:BamA/TamA family outer membrane protein [Gemmatimonadota bacterium]
MNYTRMAMTVLAMALVIPVHPVSGSTLTENSRGVVPAGTDVEQQEPRRIEGDYTVGRNEFIEDDLVVERGNLTVDGEIRGTVVVAYGDAIIRGTVDGLVVAVHGDVIVMDEGLVQGDAVSIEGSVNLRGSGVVTGSNVTTTLEGLRRQGRGIEWARAVRVARVVEDRVREEDRWDRGSRDYNRNYYRRYTHHNFLETGSFPLGGLAYNRVDGITLQGEIFNNSFDWDRAASSFYGGAGYGFKSKRLYYRLGLNRFWLPRTPIEIGIGAYKQLESEDTWTIKPNENDFHAFFVNYDWYDYYQVEGFGGLVRFSPQRWVSLGARYVQETETPVIKTTDWSLFGGDREFRDNEWLTTWDPDPLNRVYNPADPGDLKRWIYFLHVDMTSWGRSRPGKGLILDASLEQVEHESNGAVFNYERLQAQLQAYLSLSRIDHIALRVRMGSTKSDDGFEDMIPVQHRYYMGGIGSLRGYAFKQFTGNRFFLATAEYTLGADSWTPFFSDLALTVFFDYGLAWDADPMTDLYDELYPEKGNRAVGVAIAPFGWDGFRFEAARPLDADDKEFTYYVRLEFDF